MAGPSDRPCAGFDRRQIRDLVQAASEAVSAHDFGEPTGGLTTHLDLERHSPPVGDGGDEIGDVHLPPAEVGQHAIWKGSPCSCARERPRRPDVCRTLGNEGEVNVGDHGVVLQLTNVDTTWRGVLAQEECATPCEPVCRERRTEQSQDPVRQQPVADQDSKTSACHLGSYVWHSLVAFQ